AAERDVLELVAIHGLGPAEAAVALNISPNAARLRLSRARGHMRDRLGESLPGLVPGSGHA
ncbi:MAG: sigma-70 family RNA polymerase sigma factor, partial [Acidimicrobiia bacterium]|nr:sigma-70 family RNA polymerase sigma factor [Acidimicrobiia bacterium]